MAFNELNLYFGPKLPLEFETVGLSFIAAPNLRSDSAIGILSAERYAKQNYDHIGQLDIFTQGVNQAQLGIEYRSSSSSTLSGTAIGEFSLESVETLTGETWGPSILNNALKVSGIKITSADSWYPIIKPGLVWRTGYSITASGIEPSGSWLMRALDPNNTNSQDHQLILIYSVPEVLYSTASSGSYPLNFPSTQAKYKLMKEIAVATSPFTIGYNGDINILTKVSINGAIKYSGQYTGAESDSFLKSIDTTIKEISIKSSISPDDFIELEYLSYDEFYIYSGFRDFNNKWWPFDANPEFGHLIGNDNDQVFENSSDALLRQITLYAIPTAAIKYEFLENPAGSDTIGTLRLTAYRGIDYGETHYIRHLISSEPVEFINSRDEGTILNTWGHAKFSRNFYDEQNQYGGDIFNLRVPSMIPLGRFVLGAPASIQSVTLADIRERGGGVPIDFPMVAVETQTDGLDKLRSFFDMGIWEGKAIKEGGVIEIEINSSVLKTDPTSTDPNTFLASEIKEIVEAYIPPGIDYEIKYI